MNKNIYLPVTMLGVLMFAFSAAAAKDNIKTEENLSEFNAALKLAPDIDNGRELYKMCVACHGPERIK